MQKNFVRRGLMMIAMVAVLGLAGCSSSPVKEDTAGGVPNAPQADENVGATGDSDSGKANGLQTVHFPYDSFVLDEEAKNVLGANASVMKQSTKMKIQIEGHCDQRGGIQYNIALGEKRANVTRKYMADQGIAEDRMSVISFGKEKPLDNGTTEEAYAKNRRSNFVITSQ